MRILTVLGSKGGVGKSTVAAHVLVAALRDGIDAAGIDLDWQGSLVTWAAARQDTGVEPDVSVIASRLADWRQAVAGERGRALLVLDGPPGIDGEDALAALADLADAADLVLIPAPPWGMDIKAVGGIGAKLRGTFVLNRVERGPNADAAREYLRTMSDVCPIAIPKRSDIANATGAGLTALDRKGLGGAAEIEALWRWIAAKLKLT